MDREREHCHQCGRDWRTDESAECPFCYPADEGPGHDPGGRMSYTEHDVLAALQSMAAIDSEMGQEVKSYLERVGLPPAFTAQVAFDMGRNHWSRMAERLAEAIENPSGATDILQANVMEACAASFLRGLAVGLQLRRDQGEFDA